MSEPPENPPAETGSFDPAPIDPRRAATAAQRGYRYQALLALEAWLTLEPGQILVVEGDEDHDVLSVDPDTGQELRTGVQAKSYAGTLGLRSKPVRDSLRAFLATFVARRAADVTARFVFVTSADRASYAASDPARAILDRWERLDGDHTALADIVAFVRELLAVDGNTSSTSFGDHDWSAFVTSVRWQFAAPEVTPLWARVLEGVRSRFPDVPEELVELLAARLLADLWDAAGKDDPHERCRTVADLDRLVQESTAKTLDAWARSPDGARQLQALRDARAFDDLLVSGRAVAPRNPTSVGQLLGAAYTMVPWSDIGRGEVLERLLAWCDATPQHPADAVRLITGAGGTGKTRLAIELVQRLRHRGVTSGFLVERRVADRSDLTALVGPGAPRVVIIDYAETKSELVRELLSLVLEPERRDRPAIKVLLVARSAGPWWESLRASSDKLGALGEEVLLAQLGAMANDAAGRSELFWQAAQVFRDRDQMSIGAAPDLSDPVFDRVLFVHMAALAMVHGISVAGRDEILDATLTHERRFWECARNDCSDLDANRRRVLTRVTPKAVAALTLIGGASRAEAMRYVERAIDHPELVRAGAAVLEVLVDLLARQYGSGPSGDIISGLTPDLLGEHLIARTLRSEADGGLQWLRGLFPDAGDPKVGVALVPLGRAASDDGTANGKACAEGLRALIEAAPEARAVPATLATLAVSSSTAHSPLGLILANALRSCTNAELASTLEKLIPETTVAFRELTVWVSETLLAETAGERDNASEEGRASLAWRLGRLAVAYSAVGRSEDALDAGQNALDLFRRLAAVQPDTFEPDLASSLNNLATMLSALGRHEDALAVAQEALDLYRRSAAADPGSFEPDLASSLNNLGNVLSELGRDEDALVAAREALDLYRRLAMTRPDAFEPYLARSWSNLGNMLSNLGRSEDALASAQKALDLFSRLAAERPDAFVPYLAGSLSNIGNMLSALGRREEALTVLEGALAFYRRLAAARPEAFEPDLAMSLHNLGSALSDLGRHGTARSMAQETVDLYRRLAKTRPDAFDPYLALALNRFGSTLGVLDRHEDALSAVEEALDIYRRLAASRRDAFESYVARSLNNLGNRLSALGMHEDALAVAQEAVATFRRLATARPEAFEPDVAGSLNNLANRLSAVGRPEEALAAAEEGLAVRRRLAMTRPDAFEPDLAGSLNNYGQMLSEYGKHEDALRSAVEAANLIVPHARRTPGAFTGTLKMIARNYLRRCSDAKVHPDAALLARIEEAQRSARE